VRQFVKSVTGKVTSAMAIFAMILPTLVLMSLGRPAEAQVANLPSWAIVGFDVKQGLGKAALGDQAAEALINELGKTGRIDVLSAETVNRTAQNLGFVAPITNQTELLRLGQELRVSTIVSGEIINSRVVNTPSGKRGDVIMRVIVWDVASGVQVNGAALSQSSGFRSAETSDDALLQEAVTSGAFAAVSAIERNTLPTATILNTLDSEALINKGSREGFTQGQEVLIIRDRQQVARGKIKTVEPDQAFVQVTQSTKGIQPGDKVRAVFAVPTIENKFSKNGDAKVVKPKRGGNSSALISVVLVLGLIAILGSGSAGSNNSQVTGVTAQAMTKFSAFGQVPAVRVDFKTDFSIQGGSRYAFQYYRQGISAPVWYAPAAVAGGLFIEDAGDSGAFDYFNFTDDIPQIGSTVDCRGEGRTGEGGGVPVIPGISYIYGVEIIYTQRVTIGGGTGTGGTGTGTGGSTGSTGSTGRSVSADLDSQYANMLSGRQVGTGGSTTGGSGGTGGTIQTCYRRTSITWDDNVATPLNKAIPSLPTTGFPLAVATKFEANFDPGAAAGQDFECILQFSSNPGFSRASTVNVATWGQKVGGSSGGGSGGTNTVVTPSSIDPLAYFTTQNPELPIYWRIGVRAQRDVPGPVPDAATGERYIFSDSSTFTRPPVPPAP